MDTVRADGLSLYGYDRETSPNLAKFATRGVTFDRAIAPSSWTLPSHAGLFTGQDVNRLSVGIDSALDRTYPTLAEFLAQQGYATAGFAANSYFCSRWYGLDRGFAHYEDYATNPLEIFRSSGLGWWICVHIDSLCRRLEIRQRHKIAEDFVRRDAARINRDTLAWLRRRDRSRPFFAFLNYFDAHTPYVPPPTASGRFGLRPESVHDDLLLRDGIHVDDKGTTPRDIQLARDNYDDCVAYLDGQLDHLFAALAAEGGLDNTLIVVTSDHGEAFGEHGMFGHTTSVYQPVIHVPLVIAGPGIDSRNLRISPAASLSDIPATIAALAAPGVETPFPGRSILAGESTRLPIAVLQPERVLSPSEMRAFAKPGTLAAIADDHTILIRNGDASLELYDLAADPNQSRNLARSSGSKAITGRLEELLQSRLHPDPAPTR
jgi:arylsulfatase A-like enzyme